jgi:acetyl esterase/lipase
VFLSENATIRSIPGPAGDIELRCFIPPQANAAYLYIHGGGWVLGTNDSNDLRLENLSRDFGIAVVSVEYRLAPEHPYPAGPDDCEAAALWLAQNAAREFGTDKLLIGGDSAGAHLAVVSLVRLRDRHGITPYSGAILGYGFYDPALTPSAANWGDESVILSTPSLQWFSDHFVPPEKRRDPDVNPLFADLRDMPPAILTVGTMDPLLDDSLFMHARWVGAGSHAELDVQPGGVHGLTGFPTSVGKNALAHQDAFIKSILAS